MPIHSTPGLLMEVISVWVGFIYSTICEAVLDTRQLQGVHQVLVLYVQSHFFLCNRSVLQNKFNSVPSLPRPPPPTNTHRTDIVPIIPVHMICPFPFALIEPLKATILIALKSQYKTDNECHDTFSIAAIHIRLDLVGS